jgi:dipeptidase D
MVITKMTSNVDETIIARFKELSSIPRPSKKLDLCRKYIIEWAAKHEFIHRVDTYGNIVVVVGNENSTNTPIIIQSHMDIVTTKTNDSKHNFDTDPIEVIIEGNVMTANNTTLGADNGLSLVASMMLAEELFENNEFFVSNNVVYLLMTADEEIGCLGANNIGLYPFLPEKAYMLNVDSEDGGVVCAGAAGGSDCHIILPITGDLINYDSDTVDLIKLKFYGFIGGHSGLEINLGRASAIKVLVNFLYELKCADVDLLEMLFQYLQKLLLQLNVVI